ncbi:hypothetical protein XELAEV_18021509mg [Xenopus laevis]|uniref:Uncharacterized protein n=1 Tax=Xenopus laevis TaxID=8355 RepID=A0A974DBC7_XENLA|nr:hypothetical protein XELAEV_18021509mg [Xenopus laevis]
MPRVMGSIFNIPYLILKCFKLMKGEMLPRHIQIEFTYHLDYCMALELFIGKMFFFVMGNLHPFKCSITSSHILPTRGTIIVPLATLLAGNS